MNQEIWITQGQLLMRAIKVTKGTRRKEMEYCRYILREGATRFSELVRIQVK